MYGVLLVFKIYKVVMKRYWHVQVNDIHVCAYICSHKYGHMCVQVHVYVEMTWVASTVLNLFTKAGLLIEFRALTWLV